MELASAEKSLSSTTPEPGDGAAAPGIWQRTILLCAGLLLCVILPYAALSGRTSSSVSAPLLVLHTLMVILAGARLVWLFARERPGPVEVAFWLYVYGFLGVAALAQMAAGQLPSTVEALTDYRVGLPRPLSEAEARTADLIVLTGIIAYQVGLVLSGRREQRTNVRSRTTLDGFRLRVLSGVALLLSLAFVALVGPSKFIASRFAFDAAVGLRFDETVGVVAVALGTVPIWMAFLGMLLVRDHRGFQSFGSRLTLLSVALTAMFVVNPISSPRFVVGTFYGALAIVLVSRRERRRIRGVLVLIALGIIVVFPYADLFRSTTSSSVVSVGSNQSLVDLYSRKLDYDSFGQISSAADHVRDRGFAAGQQELGAVLFFVPRAIWPSKPIDTGALLAVDQGLTFTNTSAPLWAESYIDFGFAGVIAIFAALGFVTFRLDRWFYQSRDDGALLLVPLLALYQVILLRGSLLAIMGRLVGILFVYLVIARPERTESERSQHLTLGP